ncbi:MAG: Mur ligase domain-containing protein [Planctomycetota bacterium]|nr:Mur ligase domain-containing protein [Planctomycetota bacterium]
MQTSTASAAGLDKLALENGRVVVFVGVGGCGMRGLATFFLQAGWQVYGCDARPLAADDKLFKLGLEVCDVDSVPLASWVVRSAAVPASDDVFEKCIAESARPCLYAEFLGEISKIREVVAVAGTHGKTTCTAWIAYGLRQAGVEVGYLVGAEVPQLGSSSEWGDPSLPLVIESCEYARSFHHLRPSKVALINVAAEHPDTYPGGLPEVTESFAKFLSNTVDGGTIIAGPEAPSQLQQHTSATWMPACPLNSTTNIGLFGRHNRSNAALVAAVLRDFDLSDEQILHGLSTFTGAARRLEFLKELNLGNGESIKLVSDYAHHPTEVAATINAARERWPQAKINVMFQPHQAQRFQDYRELYIACLDEADMVALLPIFRARDVDSCSADSKELLPDLEARHPQRLHNFCETIEQSINWTLSNSTTGSVVLCLGAGDIDGYIRKLH